MSGAPHFKIMVCILLIDSTLVTLLLVLIAYVSSEAQTAQSRQSLHCLYLERRDRDEFTSLAPFDSCLCMF